MQFLSTSLLTAVTPDPHIQSKWNFHPILKKNCNMMSSMDHLMKNVRLQKSGKIRQYDVIKGSRDENVRLKKSKDLL